MAWYALRRGTLIDRQRTTGNIVGVAALVGRVGAQRSHALDAQEGRPW